MPKIFKSATIICLVLTSIFFTVSFGQTATVTELKQKSTSLTDQIKKLDDEIKIINKQLLDTGTEKKTLNNELAKIETTRKKLVAELSLTSTKIQKANVNLAQLQNDIGIKILDIDQNKLSIAETIRNLRQIEFNNFLEILLSKTSLSDFIAQTENLDKLQANLNNQVQSLKQNKEILEVKKTAQEDEKETLAKLKNQLSGQKQVTEEIQKEKDLLLTQTENKESNYQKILADRLKKRKEVDLEIANIEKQIQIILNPSLIPKVGTSPLNWPLDKIIVTQYFGNTEFSASAAGLVYNGRGHNGIDLGIPIGTTVMSASEGKVIGVGDTDITCRGASYGKWVLIKHTNGLSTLYGHLSVISVVEGQTVLAKQPIAFSGNTGYSTGPHLHFTVYASQGVKVSSLQSKACSGIYRLPIASYNSYLNPINYLPKI